MCDEQSIQGNKHGVVEVSIRGTTEAIHDILSGDALSAHQLRLKAELATAVAHQERTEMQEKFWKATDELEVMIARERQARHDLDCSVRQAADRAEIIQENAAIISALRTELEALKSNSGVELTDEQIAKLAADREAAFQKLQSNVAYPINKPMPRTLAELMNIFVFPIFQAGAEHGFSCTNKIAMIKQLRALTGIGLKEAKEFIEGVAVVPYDRGF